MKITTGDMSENIKNRTELEKQIDILEDDIANISPALLKILLKDCTTKENIKWCTKDYEHLGPEYDERAQMSADLITGLHFNVIQPRAAKSKEVQELRVRKRAEVFTPSWICNMQNNQIDEAWFGRKLVFNTPNDKSWITNKRKIAFRGTGKKWKDYVTTTRLEITCGEAPYLVSRYDTTTGELIPLNERIGLFDRKMRIVNENCKTDDEWIEWSIKALQSVYGYEFQGDSVLIARENVLYDYIDYYKGKFAKEPMKRLLNKVANIISWNIWQMDGLKGVVPWSCHSELVEKQCEQLSFIDSKESNEPLYKQCSGCTLNDIYRHNGSYCLIQDWQLDEKIRFIDTMKG